MQYSEDLLTMSCEACQVANSSSDPVRYVISGWRILRCNACGLLRTDADGIETADIYTAEYFQGGRPDGYRDYIGAEQYNAGEFRDRLHWLRRWMPDGKLLELGCATGAFLDVAKSAYDVEGIDVSDFAIEHAVGKGLKAHAGTLDTIGNQLTPPYDLVVLFDTIEHLPNPRNTMQRVYEMTRAGGKVALSTGDAGSVSARAFGKNWRLLTPPQHLWFFAKSNMQIMLEQLGFRVLAVEYPWRRVPVSLAWYQLFRGRRGDPPGALREMSLPVNLFDTMYVVAEKT